MELAEQNRTDHPRHITPVREVEDSTATAIRPLMQQLQR